MRRLVEVGSVVCLASREEMSILLGSARGGILLVVGGHSRLSGQRAQTR
jgi:hypothetical protein